MSRAWVMRHGCVSWLFRRFAAFRGVGGLKKHDDGGPVDG